MFGEPVVGIKINTTGEAVKRVIKVFGGMGFTFNGFFPTQENHAVIKLRRARERWFYMMFRPVPFFQGVNGLIDLTDLKRLSKDPRMEEVLFVLRNGKIFSCTVQDMILHGREGSDYSVCISIHSVRDIRNYTEYPQLPALKSQ